MPRKNRFAPPGYWLHITQRGNDRQRVFLSDADRQYFLDLLAARSQERGVRVAAYTLENLATAGVVRFVDNLQIIIGLPPS